MFVYQRVTGMMAFICYTWANYPIAQRLRVNYWNVPEMERRWHDGGINQV